LSGFFVFLRARVFGLTYPIVSFSRSINFIMFALVIVPRPAVRESLIIILLLERGDFVVFRKGFCAEL
jgi:hypothetical protein